MGRIKYLSQMISLKTVKLFEQVRNAGQTSLYYLHNIVLRMLGKKRAYLITTDINEKMGSHNQIY